MKHLILTVLRTRSSNFSHNLDTHTDSARSAVDQHHCQVLFAAATHFPLRPLYKMHPRTTSEAHSSCHSSLRKLGLGRWAIRLQLSREEDGAWHREREEDGPARLRLAAASEGHRRRRRRSRLARGRREPEASGVRERPRPEAGAGGPALSRRRASSSRCPASGAS